ncbi:MAG: toxin-antitoxin system YwqK family antitoxin [Saprospiraceae bacterium]|nr:toxin-antitoxin system YwqK family antitoxin [Saprospiraceae bacterium]
MWLTLLLQGCAEHTPSTEQVTYTDRYGYVERYHRRVSDYAKEGKYERFTPEGHRIEEANYRNDTLHGPRVLYYESGDSQIVEYYHMGEFEGPYKTFYPKGQVNLTGQYRDNAMSGEWKRYYRGGELMEVVTFEKNMENGPFREYYENGNLKAEGRYLEGDNEHGMLKLYDEEGALVRKMNCDKGICRTLWLAENENAK